MTWDYTEIEYEKQKTKDPRWHLERLILYGLNGEKIKREVLLKYLKDLNIPEERRAFLKLITDKK